jgi:signal transduction histidine kinase
VTVETELPTVMAELVRMEQVFQNLVGNAIKYNDKPEGSVRIGHRDNGDEWEFYIADNGPGIEEKHFAKVFQIFQTLRPRDEVESTGVGLAIVKRIIELYGGKIWVESVVGEGSTFIFTLPKA